MQTIAHHAGVSTVAKLEGDTLIHGTVQDCTAILENTKALHNEGHHGSADFKHAASIPLVLVEKYCNDNGVTFREFMQGSEHVRRFCNHPDNKFLRIWPGQL